MFNVALFSLKPKTSMHNSGVARITPEWGAIKADTSIHLVRLGALGSVVSSPRGGGIWGSSEVAAVAFEWHQSENVDLSAKKRGALQWRRP